MLVSCDSKERKKERTTRFKLCKNAELKAAKVNISKAHNFKKQQPLAQRASSRSQLGTFNVAMDVLVVALLLIERRHHSDWKSEAPADASSQLLANSDASH